VAGPPEDFNNEATRYRDVGNRGGPPPNDRPPAPDAGEPPLDPFDEEAEPTAWYRRPWVLIVWALTVLILIGLIIFGIVELIGDQGTTTNPKTTTTTTPTTTTTTTTPTTTSTTPTTTSPTTTETTAPTESSQQPEPQPTQQPTRQEPTRRHHWPSWLPTTIPAIP
jgi:cell division septation protein DedD